jgi:hypothetical protein
MQMKQVIELNSDDIRDMLTAYLVAKFPALPEGFKISKGYIEVSEESNSGCSIPMMMMGMPFFSGGRSSDSIRQISITNRSAPLHVVLDIPSEKVAVPDPAPAFDIADPAGVSHKEKAPLKKRTRK